MENISEENPGNKWLSVPLIATITRLLCRELTLQNDVSPFLLQKGLHDSYISFHPYT
jgi:hypothetical protein